MQQPQSTQLSLFDSAQRREPFSVRISARARRLSVRVHAGGHVEVIVPPGVRGRLVHEFVGQHKRWIDQKVAQLQTAGPPADDPALVPSQVRFSSTGEFFAIEWQQAARLRLTRTGEGLRIDSADADGARAVLRRWLIEAALERLGPWLQGVAADIGVDFERVTVRRQKTRWGSCTMRGHISLNCCLMFQAAEVVRYLFVHELAHIHHPNHSALFWRYVEKYEPQYRELDRQLLAGWANVPAWVFQT